MQHDAPSTYAGLGGGSGAEDAFVGKVYVDLNPLLMRVQDREGRAQGGQLQLPAARQRRMSWGGAGEGEGEEQREGLGLAGGGVGSGGGEDREVWGKDAGEEALVIQGWFPLYDTLRGVRGDLHIVVKLQFVGNENPFRDSSAGVRFFAASLPNPEASQPRGVGWLLLHVYTLSISLPPLLPFFNLTPSVYDGCLYILSISHPPPSYRLLGLRPPRGIGASRGGT